MSKIKERLELFASICVVVVVIFVGNSFYQSYTSNNSTPVSLSKGQQIPRLPGYGWNSSPHTLLLALRNGCHFCEESMPFYRKLAELKKENRLNVRLIAVLPDHADVAVRLLRSQHVDIPIIAGVNLLDLKVAGTPTLILADSQGKVENYWMGKQDEKGQKSILAAIDKEQQSATTQ